jgi:hypothetical protein
MEMFWKCLSKALVFLVILAIFVGGGFVLYKAGYARGVTTGAWLAEQGGEITPSQSVPQPGLIFKPYGRPVFMFPVFGLVFGVLLLVFAIGGFRHLAHYKIWKSAGMPSLKDWRPEWHEHHRSGYWGPHSWATGKAPAEAESAEDTPGEEPE